MEQGSVPAISGWKRPSVRAGLPLSPRSQRRLLPARAREAPPAHAVAISAATLAFWGEQQEGVCGVPPDKAVDTAPCLAGGGRWEALQQGARGGGKQRVRAGSSKRGGWNTCSNKEKIKIIRGNIPPHGIAWLPQQ